MKVYMDEFIFTFRQLDKIISEKYSSFDLLYINEILIDGKNPLTFFTEMTSNIDTVNQFKWYEFYTEIQFLSKDLKYYTALLFLLRPYINHPLRENKTYFQTMEDKRYMSYASILYQILYNYWDRIGDFLYCFFDTGLKERNVYFSTVINNFPSEYSKSSNFLELKSMYNKKLKNLIKDRKRIVHYLQISARMFTSTFLHYNDDKKLKEMEKEKDGYPEFFRDHIKNTLKGFEYSVRLVNELK